MGEAHATKCIAQMLPSRRQLQRGQCYVSVMVLGSSGMFGHMLTTCLEDLGVDVVAVSRHGTFGSNPVAVDLRDGSSLVREIRRFQPTWIVNAAGLLNDEVDQMKSDAILVNSYLPQFLAEIGPRLGFRLITVGSDCVFQGDRGPYSVADLADARSAYGKTKYLGEVNNDTDLTIRTSIIGPEVDPNGRGLMLWTASQEGKVQGWAASVWTGVTTLELAQLVEAQVTGEINERGLWQYVPSHSITKFDLVCLMNHTLFGDRLSVEKVPGAAHDRSLINDRPGVRTAPSYEGMLLDLRVWINEHDYLYKDTPFRNIGVAEPMSPRTSDVRAGFSETGQ